MRLQGHLAVVPGATYGIGAPILERMAEEGAAVVFIGRSGDKGAEAEASLRAKGLEVTFIQGSVAVEADVQRCINTAVEKYGTLTTVVNNAAATDITKPG